MAINNNTKKETPSAKAIFSKLDKGGFNEILFVVIIKILFVGNKLKLQQKINRSEGQGF